MSIGIITLIMISLCLNEYTCDEYCQIQKHQELSILIKEKMTLYNLCNDRRASISGKYASELNFLANEEKELYAKISTSNKNKSFKHDSINYLNKQLLILKSKEISALKFLKRLHKYNLETSSYKLYSYNDLFFILTTKTGNIALNRVSDGKTIFQFPEEHTTSIDNLLIIQNKYLVTASNDDNISIWNLHNNELIGKVVILNLIHKISNIIEEEFPYFIVNSENLIIKIHLFSLKKEVAEIKNCFTCFSLYSGNNKLINIRQDGYINTYDIATGLLIEEIKSFEYISVTYTKLINKDVLLIGKSNGTIEFWKINTNLIKISSFEMSSKSSIKSLTQISENILLVLENNSKFIHLLYINDLFNIIELNAIEFKNSILDVVLVERMKFLVIFKDSIEVWGNY